MEKEALSENHQRILRNLREQLSLEELSPFDISICIPPNGDLIGISTQWSIPNTPYCIYIATHELWKAQLFPNKTIIMKIACRRISEARCKAEEIVSMLEKILNMTVVTCELTWV